MAVSRSHQPQVPWHKGSPWDLQAFQKYLPAWPLTVPVMKLPVKVWRCSVPSLLTRPLLQGLCASAVHCQVLNLPKLVMFSQDELNPSVSLPASVAGSNSLQCKIL